MKKKLIDKNPHVKIDPSLNKYKDVVLFPEKLAQANATLKRVGLPKELKQPQEQK